VGGIMQKRNYEEVKHFECVTKKIICNKCGKEIPIIPNRSTNPHTEFEDYFHGEMRWDYCQKGYDEQFDLCPDCFNKLIETFKIPVDRYLKHI